jgi:acetyl esterase/lipase
MKMLSSLLLVLAVLPADMAASAPERDWGAVQLAWRGDPRATADAPFEAEAAPARRPSRRAQRRAANRRRMPFDDLNIGVAPPETAPDAGMDVVDVITSRLPAPPLRVESTLESPFAPPAAVAPQGEILVHRDQPSLPTADARQRFDMFLPAGCAGGGMPLVVWIHGDTWRDGSRADCPVRWLADEGYAVASIGYRLTDSATFPAQLDDCRAALEEIRRTAEVWGIDRDRIAVVGSGAGGHLAALVGLSGPGEARVAAVCAVAAPTHLTSLGPDHDRPACSWVDHSPNSARLPSGPVHCPTFRETTRPAS